MDNVTHSLTGLALARAGFNRLSPRATLLLLLAANAPDIDILAAPFGALRYFEAHRGYTHSLLFLPIMAAISVLVTYLIYREKPAGRRDAFRAWLLACAGVASHLLLDWTNPYGVRLLLPFSSRWFALDLNNLTDGIFLTALVLAAIWPLFSRLVGGEIGEQRVSKGQGSAIAVLVFFLVLDFGRFLMHARVVAQLSSRLYDGAIPTTVAALPYAINPLHWTGIVETPDSFHSIDVDHLHNAEPQAGAVLYKRPFDPVSDAVRNTPPFHYLQYFSRFPIWSAEPVTLPSGSATRIDLTDLRFGAPGVGSFHCVGLVNTEGRVLLSVFTFGSGANVGRGR
ncbi:MAG: rane-bound metal-dependent hydrolase [Bryobacterales bacterium]|jgi:inner membrane protein|nr:rane-bound metal-dependent hydrolase [Bryobacterales bacterium]